MRRKFVVLGVVGLAVAGLAAWLLWPRSDPPKNRDHLEFTACLLTDHDGLQGADAARIWEGMQQASQSTRAKVRYFATSGAQTTENAAALLASLTQQQCRVVFVTGDRPVAAARQDAPRYTGVQFFLIGGGTANANLHNVAVSVPAEVPTKVAAIVRQAVAVR
jgi:basic membrane lipoprotein Med (substrate-binding protein (PBP1-ABC) superfamily)